MAERYQATDVLRNEELEPAALSKRAALSALAGVLIGLVIVAGLWWRTGRNATSLPSLTELRPYAAPSFTLKDIQGGTVNLSDFGGKVVLLNFWATWCLPCREETPDLQAVYEQLKHEGLVIIGVNRLNTERRGEDGLQDVREFMARFGVSYQIALDDSGTIGQAFAIAPIPTSYVIDQQGRVRFVRVGKLSKQEVERVFRRLQAEQQASSEIY